MAQGNELGGILGGHDAGQPRRGPDVPFGEAAGQEQGEHFGTHHDPAASRGPAQGLGLVRRRPPCASALFHPGG